MNYWFFVNLALFLYTVGLIIFSESISIYESVATFFAMIGLLFILFNWNMHALFSKIRTLKKRVDRIKLAKRARKIMPYHMSIGFASFAFISLHILFVFHAYGLELGNFKIVSGGAACIGLMAVVISGWMRRKKATGKRRRAHLYLAMTLFILITVHILVKF